MTRRRKRRLYKPGPKRRVKLGSLLAGIGRQAKLTGRESAVFELARDKTPARPPSFE